VKTLVWICCLIGPCSILGIIILFSLHPALCPEQKKKMELVTTVGVTGGLGYSKNKITHIRLLRRCISFYWVLSGCRK